MANVWYCRPVEYFTRLDSHQHNTLYPNFLLELEYTEYIDIQKRPPVKRDAYLRYILQTVKSSLQTHI